MACSQPRDILCGAAEEVLSTLKDDHISVSLRWGNDFVEELYMSYVYFRTRRRRQR